MPQALSRVAVPTPLREDGLVLLGQWNTRGIPVRHLQAKVPDWLSLLGLHKKGPQRRQLQTAEMFYLGSGS